MAHGTPIAASSIRGVGFILLAIFIFSLQNIAVKRIGGDYPLLEIVSFRSVVAIPLTLLFFRLEGKRGFPKTRRARLQFLRGLCYFLSYTAHFMALAALSLAEIAAIKYSAPLMITLLSVVLLRETVGPRRWLALLVGFSGVLLVIQPGSANFNVGSIFELISVLSYAFGAMVTRKLQTTESSATQAFYTSLVYLIGTAVIAPVVILIGDFPDAHPSVVFLFHAWAIPSLLDWLIMSSLGLLWAAGMYCIARAYSLSAASVVAPFEYAALPVSIMWDVVLWQVVPTWITLFGAFLTLSSGLYVFYHERRRRERA